MTFVKHNLVILSIKGLTLTEADKRCIKHRMTGGVILFSRNFTKRTQLLKLTQAIRQVRSDVLICIDHEGGRVQRICSDGFTHLPAMADLGVLWEQDSALALRAASACAYILGAELRVHDIDLSFTPLLDLDYQRSQIIGNRSFHRNPMIVSKLGLAINEGLALAGMRNCGKHFPGHGYAVSDSHLTIARDERSFKEIFAQDILPYQALNSTLSAIMAGHVVYENVDSKQAGFSKYWLQTVLRKELSFDGVIISDDIAMQGSTIGSNILDASCAAIEAGCDMLLICNQEAQDMEALLDCLMGRCQTDQDLQLPCQDRINKLFPSPWDLDWESLHCIEWYVTAQNLLKNLNLTR